MSDLKKSLEKLKDIVESLQKNEDLARKFEELLEGKLEKAQKAAKGDVVDMKSRKKIADDSTVGSKENDKLADDQANSGTLPTSYKVKAGHLTEKQGNKEIASKRAKKIKEYEDRAKTAKKSKKTGTK